MELATFVCRSFFPRHCVSAYFWSGGSTVRRAGIVGFQASPALGMSWMDGTASPASSGPEAWGVCTWPSTSRYAAHSL